MAKIFDKIVQSATEPSKNDIWLKEGQLKAFQNGQWKSLSPQVQGGTSDGIQIVNSINKLDPNAKVGSVASVATEKSMQLLNIASLPIAERDSDYSYIFSEHLVKVDDVDINIIKQTLSYEDYPPYIELHDFTSQYYFVLQVSNDGIIYANYKSDSGEPQVIYYYDSATDTVNPTVINDIREILKNGDYRIVYYGSVDDYYSQECVDWMLNTFELYSISGDTDAELFIKKDVWEPLISNDDNTENGDENDAENNNGNEDVNNIPEFTLNFGTLGRLEISGISTKTVGYNLVSECMEESEVNFVEGKAKIKIYLETDLFKTIDPIIAEVTIGNKFGGMTYNFVNIDTNFNQVKVLYYDDSYTGYISGTLTSKYDSGSLQYHYYLTISNDVEVLIDPSINTEDKIKTLLGIIGVNTRPCKFILPTYNNYGDCIVPGVIDAENIDNVYINVIYNSNISKYKVNTNNITFVEKIITSDASLNVNVDNDSLDATVAQSLYGRLSSSNIKSLYFILNGATYSVNSVVPSGEYNKWYVTFGSDIIYKYLIYCYPATASPITFKGQILERKSFDLNSLIAE